MQFRVPQNIDLPDKIIGPLTLQQFLWLLAGGAVFYIIYSWAMKMFGMTSLAVLLGLPPVVLAGMFAFVKINERPFTTFVVSFFVYLFSSRDRVWQKIEEVEVFKPEEKPKEKPKIESEKEKEIKSKLDELAMIIQTRGWSKVEEEKEKEEGEINLEGRVLSAPEERPKIKSE